MKRFALTLAVMVALCPTYVWAQDNGAAAFADRNFDMAKQLWLSEAAHGSAEAMLGLGLLADRGFGQQRDFDEAFGWYSQAADLGLSEAQFNVAIMLDAGLGRARDAQQAHIWYTRAALRDHARAQYNLGLLFESGDGIASNDGLASFWFSKAARSLTAAADKSLTQASSTRSIASPNILFADVGPSQLELVWNTDPASSPRHLVEVLNVPGSDENYAAPEISVTTAGSGILDMTVRAGQDAVWRVVNIAGDDSDYAASEWLGTQDTLPLPGRITLLIDPELEAMAAAADVFASALRDAGYWVQIDQVTRTEFDGFYVSYGYASDQDLAQSVAAFLPSTGQIFLAKQVLRATQPGEIVVNLGAMR